MLKIASSSKVPQTAVPGGQERLSTQQTTLSVSWIDGVVKALAVDKGTVEGAWESPDLITDAAGFASVLRQAIAHTGYKGTNVSIALGHPRLGQQLLTAPPTTRTNLMRFIERQVQLIMYLGVPPDLQPALIRYIQRQVQSLKSFDGEAAWCFEYTAPIEETNGLLVHLFPREILNTLANECNKADLRLSAVVPITAVLQSQCQHLPIKQDEVAMLVGDTGRSSAVVVSRADGQLYLSRVLTGSWAENAEHLIVDLQRTAVFVKEEYGVNVSSVWLFGPDAPKHVPEVQAETGIPTGESPVPWDAYYWPRALCLLVPAMMPNLVSREQLHAPGEKLWMKFVAAGAIVLVLLCLGTTAYLEWMLRAERAGLKALQGKIAQAEKQKAEAQRYNEELETKREIIKLVDERRLPPVPGWFMGYLSEAVPQDLLLTSLRVYRENEQWHLKVAGVPQPSTNAPSVTVFTNAVEQFKRRLATGPFHVAFVGGTKRDASSGKAGAPVLPSWVTELGKVSPEKVQRELQFEFEGVME